MRDGHSAARGDMIHDAIAEGYAIKDGVLTPSECSSLLELLDAGPSRRGRAGTRHLMSHASVAALAADPRLMTMAQTVLGAEVTPYRATLFAKSGRSNWLVVWHQDTALPLATRFDGPGWGPWSVKGGILYAHAPTWALEKVLALRVHLDASTPRNGPLRVVPGSHAAGVLSDEGVVGYARSHRHTECVVGTGGILAMRPLIIHSSSKAESEEPRRVLHIEYAERLDLGVGVRLAVV